MNGPTLGGTAQYSRPVSFLRRGLDVTLMGLVEESGRNVQRCGLLLHDLLVDYPEHATLAQDLKVCEQEGDRITHGVVVANCGSRPGAIAGGVGRHCPGFVPPR